MSKNEATSDGPSATPCYAPVGTRVEICDGSGVHGGKGVIYLIRDGVCVVELDAGFAWLVTAPCEYKLVSGE